MIQMAIIADDLTGASDSGVQFARKGLITQVFLNLQNLASNTEQIETAVVDTDSRSLSAGEAYKRVKKCAGKLQKAGFTHIYKKMDSTLRGNIGSEIDGVLDVFPFEISIIAPAFPKNGRTTINGSQFLNGVTINRTEIGHDPKSPVVEPDLVKLLSVQSRRKTGLIGLEVIRGGNESILSRVAQLLQEGVQLMVCDAETDDDLERIAELARSDHRVLWAGSAGLADFLPQKLGLPVRPQQRVVIPATFKQVMLVAGSISGVTREQVKEYCKVPTVVAVEMNPVLIAAGSRSRKIEIDRCTRELSSALDEGNDVALLSGSSRLQVESAIRSGDKIGLSTAEVANLIVDALGVVACRLVTADKDKIQGLILTGGDTAKAVCKHLGVTGLRLLKELEPGVPIGRLTDNDGLVTVTKAGAFGSPETLINALYALKGGSCYE